MHWTACALDGMCIARHAQHMGGPHTLLQHAACVAVLLGLEPVLLAIPHARALAVPRVYVLNLMVTI